MSVETGLGQGVWIAGIDCSGDTGSWSMNSPTAMQDITPVANSAMTRLPLQRDGSVTLNQFFNDATGGSFQNLKANAFSQVLNFDVAIVTGNTLGDPAWAGRFRQTDMPFTRAQTGEFTYTTNWVGNGYGVEWGRLLTAGTNGKRTDTTATAPATGVDFNQDGGSSTAFGWQAWLHVFAFTGTSVTVTIQDSADNSSFSNLTGGAFTAATAIGTQRLEGGRTATVRRYLKVNTTGTFSNAVFGVIFNRNLTATEFTAA